MVKIIRKFKYRGICDKCGIEIGCEKEDLIKMQTGVNEFEDFALCPICGDAIRVK